MTNLRTIKITNKKVTMKPSNKKKGLVEIWSITPWTNNNLPKEYIVINDIRYYLQSSVKSE